MRTALLLVLGACCEPCIALRPPVVWSHVRCPLPSHMPRHPLCSARRRCAHPQAVAVPAPLAPLAGIAVLATVIVIHELGHYSAARAQGIRVDEFSIGFGPVLLRLPHNDVPVVLRALPIGGFVSFPRKVNRSRLEERGLLEPGEEFEGDLVVDGPDLLQNRPIAQRALVVSAGIAANLLLAWSLLFVAAGTRGVPSPVGEQPVNVLRLMPQTQPQTQPQPQPQTQTQTL